jgi:CRP/FNR family cyclic AMP-dependent transcriptional regulator
MGAMIEDTPLAEEHCLLAKVDIFEGLPQPEVDYVATHSVTVHLDKKESFVPDEDPRRIFLLLRGWVLVHEPSAEGKDLTISVVEGGTVLGQTGFALQRSRALRVEALEPSLLGVVEWEDFEALVFRNPKVGVKTIRLLSERLAVCEVRLSDQVSKEVPARLASLVIGLSEQQRVVTGDGSRRIPLRYTHEQLASMVGSNREAVTRAFGRLRKAGAVELRNRQIYVTDAEALSRLAKTGR